MADGLRDSVEHLRNVVNAAANDVTSSEIQDYVIISSEYRLNTTLEISYTLKQSHIVL